MSRRRNRAMRTAGRKLEALPSRRLPLPLVVRRYSEPDVARSKMLAVAPLKRRRVAAKPVFMASVSASHGKLGAYDALRALWMVRPKRVWFCLKRRVRREVLFAYDRAGRSGSAPKRHYRRSADSLYSC